MVSSGAVVAQYFETEGVSHFIHVNRYLIKAFTVLEIMRKHKFKKQHKPSSGV